MTEIELKCINLIIDRYTTTKDGGYYGRDYKQITEENIKRIKDEIKTLVTNKED